MGKTISEKIIERHCDTPDIKAGQIVKANIDLAMGNDVSGSMAVNIFNAVKAKTVFDREKIALVADHFVPNKDIKSAQQVKVIRDFARNHNITHYYENEGIEHALLPERGLVLPGQLVAGADSHTVTYGALGVMAIGVGATDLAAALITGWIWLKVPETIKIILKGAPQKWLSGKDVILHVIKLLGVDGAAYKTIEFHGEGLAGLSIESRFTMANMAAEAGAKAAMFPVDDKVREFLSSKTDRRINYQVSDDDAGFIRTEEINLENIDLQVAFPHLPSNSKNISDIEKTEIDQVVIGSCTNGWFEDLKVAAEILRGKKVCKGLRLIVIPATREIYRQALKEGLLDVFIEAGAVVSPPTCGPCLGGFMGVLAEGEKSLATTNRNFVGRMGHKKSEVFLAGPAVAAASAVMGFITHPEEVVN